MAIETESERPARERANLVAALERSGGKVTGVPTANVTGQGGFCTLEPADDPAVRGYEFLVRFFARSTGNLLVTVRTNSVEQVFCTSQAGGAITFADLTLADPTFIEVPLAAVRGLNPIVAQSIR